MKFEECVELMKLLISQCIDNAGATTKEERRKMFQLLGEAIVQAETDYAVEEMMTATFNADLQAEAAVAS